MRIARLVIGNDTCETGSMTGILEQLMWEFLKKGRKDSSLIMLYKGLMNTASISTNDPPHTHTQTGAPGIIILCNFEPHWLGLNLMSNFFP